jgi:hypothetical protein
MKLDKLGDLRQPLNDRNESKALACLTGIAAFALSRFSTTVEQDEEILASGLDRTQNSGEAVSLSDEKRLAVRFRLEKKKILTAAIQRLGLSMQELKSRGGGKPNMMSKGEAATPKGFGKQRKPS